jgi:hypothetical protein
VGQNNKLTSQKTPVVEQKPTEDDPDQPDQQGHLNTELKTPAAVILFFLSSSLCIIIIIMFLYSFVLLLLHVNVCFVESRLGLKFSVRHL